MLPPLPRCSGWASSSLVSPNRVSLLRFHVRIGLHIVLFEACSAFTCVAACTLARSPYVVTAIRRLQTLRLLHACSGRFRLERSPGGACTHWKSAALSRRTWKANLGVGERIGFCAMPRLCSLQSLFYCFQGKKIDLVRVYYWQRCALAFKQGAP